MGRADVRVAVAFYCCRRHVGWEVNAAPHRLRLSELGVGDASAFEGHILRGKITFVASARSIRYSKPNEVC